jgi:uncharacterized membrane protein AbrB (regulator of aidB expression)
MPLLQHSLLYGLILSVLLLAVIVASALLQRANRPATAPADGQAAASDPQLQRKALAVPVLLVMVGALAAAVWSLPSTGLTPTFGTVFICAFLVAFVFNVFDLLVIDWLLVVAWHPAWFIPPGTEGDAANRDIRFHFKGFLKGLGFSLAAGLMTAVINGLITGRWPVVGPP